MSEHRRTRWQRKKRAMHSEVNNMNSARQAPTDQHKVRNGEQGGPSRPLRVVLADDHALVREGTRRLLEVESDVEVVAEAASGEEAVDAAQRLHPDIAIIDIAMPGMGGIEATRKIKVYCPGTAVLVLSAYDDEPYLIALLDAGASGFCLQNVRGS